jgi:hypothetical protein
VEDLTPSQKRLRQQIEAGIALAGPLLDGVLAIGEKISRLAEPEDYEYYPVREEDESSAVSPRAATATPKVAS